MIEYEQFSFVSNNVYHRNYTLLILPAVFLFQLTVGAVFLFLFFFLRDRKMRFEIFCRMGEMIEQAGNL